MASIMKCVNGHFYDAEKSRTCPYCEKQANEPVINRRLEFYPGGMPEFSAEESDDSKTVAMPATQDFVHIGGEGRQGGTQVIGADEEGVTVGFLSKATGTAYVTGWLVGKTGPVKGRDYRIYPNYNWIGRSFGADVVIREAQNIAEKQHCAVVYDYKSNRFFLSPGMGTTTYLNGDLLDGPKQLVLGDEISMGGLLFEFVPFCREGHTWEA